MYDQADKLAEIVKAANHLVVVQADNPDADSLASALALEHILGDQAKQVSLYCGVDIPTYLRYMPGWDRVETYLPNQFDAAVVVDASTLTLLEKLSSANRLKVLSAKPTIVLDHHESVERPIDFASVLINDPTRSSTGELIYLLAKQLNYEISLAAQQLIMQSILGDTQGLSNQLATSATYRLVADLIDAGVNRAELEEKRRAYSKMPEAILRYKADLIKRIELSHDNQIAAVSIPQSEINRYSPLYNPAPLIQGDMLQTEGVEVAIVFKDYDEPKLTAAIRTNPASPIAAKLAESFCGGGHAHASGFKVTDGKSLIEIKNACLQKAAELLKETKL